MIVVITMVTIVNRNITNRDDGCPPRIDRIAFPIRSPAPDLDIAAATPRTPAIRKIMSAVSAFVTSGTVNAPP